MTPTPSRESWWDDLAAMCAAPVARSPHSWLIGAALLALLLGRHETDAAAGVQIAAGALIGALFVRLETVRSGAFPLWLVPAAAAAAHVLDTPSYFDLGHPLAVAAGALLVWEGVVSQRRLPTPVGVVLVWGGLAAARAGSIGHDSLPSEWLHALDLGWPLAIAGAALMLRGPSREEQGDERPRRAGAHAATWLAWGFAPAAVMAFPDPAVLSASRWQAPLDFEPAAALLAVAFAVRAADRLVVDEAPLAAAARDRVVERIASRPWISSVMLVVLVTAAVILALGTERAMLELPAGAPVLYSAALVGMPFPAVTCGYAVLAHGPFRRLRGVDRIAPYLAIVGVGVVAALAPYVPVFVAEELPLINLWTFAIHPWRFVVLVPVVMGVFVSAREHAAGVVELLALLATISLPVAWIWLDVGSAPAAETFTWKVLFTLLPAAYLFHRLVACRVRARTLVIGAVLAAMANTIALVALELDPDSPFAPGPGHAPFPSLANPNQLRVFLPIVVGWFAALLPLFFARAIAGASEEASCTSSDRRPGL